MSELKPFTVERPWGSFEQFTRNSPSTVKIISVRKGEEFSLQYHNHRTEFWKIISGSPEVTIGDSIIQAKKGDEFEVLPKVKHRVNALDNDTEILEIAYGEFDEHDLIRIEDKYGRT